MNLIKANSNNNKFKFSKKDFSKRIRDIRESKCMSQMDFAASFGTTQTTLSQWENELCDKIPQTELLLKCCETHSISLEHLMYGKDRFPPSPELLNNYLGLDYQNTETLRKNKVASLRKAKTPTDRKSISNAIDKLKTINFILRSDGILQQIMYYLKYGQRINKVSHNGKPLVAGGNIKNLRINDYSSDFILESVKEHHINELRKAIDKAINNYGNPFDN